MDELTLDAKEKIEKTILVMLDNYKTLRTGRASPALLDRVEAEYYGDKIPVNQIAMVSVPEPRQLLVKPYSKDDLKAIASAIAASNLGLNPQIDGDQIRLVLPQLTEDARRDLVKRAKAFTEDCKVAVRNIRRDYMDLIKDDDVYTEDLQKRIEQELQKLVDDKMKEIDTHFQNKEKEIMSI